MGKFNEQEECLVNYIYNLIKSGEGYELQSYTNYRAEIEIPRKWFGKDTITLSTSWDGKWGFTINSDVVIYTELAYMAMGFLEKKHKEKNNYRYYSKIEKWYKKFACGQ